MLYNFPLLNVVFGSTLSRNISEFHGNQQKHHVRENIEFFNQYNSLGFQYNSTLTELKLIQKMDQQIKRKVDGHNASKRNSLFNELPV